MKKESLERMARKLWAERAMLPEAQVGEYSITHTPVKPGDRQMVVGLREAFMTGLPQTDMIVREPTVVHKLVGPEGVWMSDIPAELVQMQRELASHVRGGKVLIGGLGLGLVANMVAKKSSVKQVTVIERQPEVIKLVEPYLDAKVTVTEGDIFEYLNPVGKGYFDIALLDTWQGTGEWVWQTEVVPLRRLIGDKIKRVYCWQEQTMIGQVARGAIQALALPAEMNRGQARGHYYAFAKAVEAEGIDTAKATLSGDQAKEFHSMIEAEQINGQNAMVVAMVRAFVYRVGSQWWEKTFGKYWDDALKTEAA